jgi:hypothetical protein
MTIENVGSESQSAPITNEQVEKCAQLIARGSRLTGIKPARATVIGHRDCDSVNRMYCPTRYNLDYLLGRIINRANQILTGTKPTVGGLPLIFKPIYRYGTMGVGTNIRTAPSISASIHHTTKVSMKRFMIGAVPGQSYNGSTEWLTFWTPNVTSMQKGKWIFVHKSLVRF